VSLKNIAETYTSGVLGSCFEDLFEKDITVQSEFKLDEWFKNYNFLVLK
jgi:hypothetical protein